MYIRTKGGRIAEVKENMAIKRCSENVLRLVYKDNQSICVLNGNDDIVNQAETIEELCDGFIGITTKEYPNRPDIEPSIHYFNKPFEFMYGNNIIKHLKLIDVELKNQNGWSYPTKKWFEDCDIYGFIRTSKGLIYVAKMNDKGELELI